MADDTPWRCFHCDEVFTDRAAAADHFGSDPMASPACQISAEQRGLLNALRNAEDEIARYRGEDSDKDRAMAAMAADHAQALVRAEEAGYAKGLRDAQHLGRTDENAKFIGQAIFAHNFAGHPWNDECIDCVVAVKMGDAVLEALERRG